MIDSERLWVGMALSLFLHFMLAIWHPADESEKNNFNVVLEMDMSSSTMSTETKQGTWLEAVSTDNRKEADQLDRKRRAYLRYIENVDDTIRARRLNSSRTALIGVALCAFTIQPYGTFTDIRIVSTFGRPEPDISALRAVHAASGVVRRSDILGPNPIQVSFAGKISMRPAIKHLEHILFKLHPQNATPYETGFYQTSYFHYSGRLYRRVRQAYFPE